MSKYLKKKNAQFSLLSPSCRRALLLKWLIIILTAVQPLHRSPQMPHFEEGNTAHRRTHTHQTFTNQSIFDLSIYDKRLWRDFSSIYVLAHTPFDLKNQTNETCIHTHTHLLHNVQRLQRSNKKNTHTGKCEHSPRVSKHTYMYYLFQYSHSSSDGFNFNSKPIRY